MLQLNLKNYFFIQGPAPLTPGAPYPTLQTGSSSLHSSPMHGNRKRNQRDPTMQWGSVDLGDMRSPSAVDLRTEVQRHRDALQTDIL